jgi:hypothetical protein
VNGVVCLASSIFVGHLGVNEIVDCVVEYADRVTIVDKKLFYSFHFRVNIMRVSADGVWCSKECVNVSNLVFIRALTLVV